MKLTTFNPADFSRSGKYALTLQLADWPDSRAITVLLARGHKPGKTLVATAGVHGDEFEGVRSILDVFDCLNPDQMSGDLVAVPVANTCAFWNGVRTNPEDGQDLARVFPGSADGSATSQIADVLARSVIRWADLYIDLHSAGVKLLMPTMVGYDARDPSSLNAALAFGAEVIWGHSQLSAGRTISFAQQHRIPWLYTEARGAGRIDEDDLHVFRTGLLNLLRHLAILSGEIERRPVKTHLFGNGDTDTSIRAQRTGMLIPRVRLLQRVKRNEELGRSVNLSGQIVERFCAPCDGVVAMLRAWPTVQTGDPLFLLSQLAEQQMQTDVLS